MRTVFSLFTTLALLHFVMNSQQARRDFINLFNHALPVVKNFLQSLAKKTLMRR